MIHVRGGAACVVAALLLAGCGSTGSSPDAQSGNVLVLPPAQVPPTYFTWPEVANPPGTTHPAITVRDIDGGPAQVHTGVSPQQPAAVEAFFVRQFARGWNRATAVGPHVWVRRDYIARLETSGASPDGTEFTVTMQRAAALGPH